MGDFITSDGSVAQPTVLMCQDASDDSKAVYLVATNDGAIITVDPTYYHIHNGTAFMISKVQSGLGDGDTLGLTFVTCSDCDIHVTFVVSGLYEYYARVYESPTVNVEGATTTPVNRNFASDNMSDITARFGDTFTDKGDVKWEAYVASGQRSGGPSGTAGEMILKKDTTYLFELESDRANNVLSGQLDWHDSP
ncbi:MAG: hypothetical protein GY847_28950 [Proteobacteria bacterium]|nr:hypothetical protein [Pseudomonadota bacterium]